LPLRVNGNVYRSVCLSPYLSVYRSIYLSICPARTTQPSARKRHTKKTNTLLTWSRPNCSATWRMQHRAMNTSRDEKRKKRKNKSKEEKWLANLVSNGPLNSTQVGQWHLADSLVHSKTTLTSMLDTILTEIQTHTHSLFAFLMCALCVCAGLSFVRQQLHNNAPQHPRLLAHHRPRADVAASTLQTAIAPVCLVVVFHFK
jgi:hypothetical protein